MPAARDVGAMYGRDSGPLRQQVFDVMSGWPGGPNRYGMHRRAQVP
jgi:hypothetical protein